MGFLAELLTYWTISGKIRREELGDNIKESFQEIFENMTKKGSESRSIVPLNGRVDFAADEMDYLGLKYVLKHSEYKIDSKSGQIKIHFYGKPENPHTYVAISCTAYDQNNVPVYTGSNGIYLDEEFKEIVFGLYSVEVVPYKLTVRAEWNGKKDWLKREEAEKAAEKENVPKERTVDEPPVIKEKPGIIVLLTFLLSVIRVAFAILIII